MSIIFTEPLQVEKIKISINNLPTNLEGTKIVQLSDLHYDGIRLTESLLSQAIEVNNQEDPDLVVITGDFVTSNPRQIKNLVPQLKRLQSRVGVFGCLGNHDLILPNSKQIIIDALAKIKVQILWNQIAYPLGQELALVGLPDFWSREFNPGLVLPQINSEIPRIVLSHNPDSAAILKKWRVDLQLSGHTHGGQVIIPGYGPAPKILQSIRRRTPKLLQQKIPYLRACSKVVQHWQWSAGWHQIAKNQLYVNRGLATYAPGRFGCPPEITIITLEAK